MPIRKPTQNDNRPKKRRKLKPPPFDRSPATRVGARASTGKAPVRSEAQRETFRTSEERVRLATEAAKMFSWECDLLAQRVDWSENAAALIGCARSELPADARESAFFADPEDADRMSASFMQLIRRHEASFSFEFRGTGEGAQARHWKSEGCIIYDKTGRARRIVAVTQDITSRKRAEEALRASEARYRALSMQMPGSAAFIFDENQRYAAAEGEALALIGMRPGDLVGKTPVEALGAGEYHLQELVRRALAGEPFEHEHFLFGRHFLSRGLPLKNDRGVITSVLAVACDITERKKAEAALDESSNQLRLALSAGRMGVWIWDVARGTVITDNLHRMLWDLESDQAEVQADAILGRIHPEDRWKVTANGGLERISGPFNMEFRVARRTGEVCWLRATATPVRNNAGLIEKIVGVNWDVTERKKAEEALRKSELRFRASQESSLFGFTILKSIRDSEGQIVDFEWEYVNPAASKLLKRPADALIGKRLLKELPNNKSSRLFDTYVRVVETGQPNDYELFYKGEGLEGWYHNVAVRLEDGVAVSFTDVTSRKHAECALRESEERLRLAQAAGQIGIFDYNVLTGELHWDDRLRELWGVSHDKRIDYELFLSFLHPEDRASTHAAVQKALDPNGDGSYYAEYRLPLGGFVRWIAARGHATFSQGRAVRLIGTAQDVTQQKDFQAELERQVLERTAKLHELVGELEHFSYSITHDMRAPLRAMRGFAEIMKEMCADSGQPELKTFLKQIITSAERMDLLITDALNYSRTVRQELPLGSVDLGKLIAGMLDTYPEFLANRSHIRLQGPLPTVFGNEAGLTQCFSNLIGNALKFVGPNQEPEVLVRADALGGAGWVRVWVEDKGIGIPENMLPRIFNMFTRGSAKYEGTGIGLALVRKVVQRMGGSVGVESEPGKGSRFYVYLRIAPEGTVSLADRSLEFPPAQA